jgi:hypothetical protein
MFSFDTLADRVPAGLVTMYQAPAAMGWRGGADATESARPASASAGATGRVEELPVAPAELSTSFPVASGVDQEGVAGEGLLPARRTETREVSTFPTRAASDGPAAMVTVQHAQPGHAPDPATAYLGAADGSGRMGERV